MRDLTGRSLRSFLVAYVIYINMLYVYGYLGITKSIPQEWAVNLNVK